MNERKRILIVDDEDDLRSGLLRLVSRKGYQAEGVANGRDAIDRVQKAGWYDLIILDVLMPVQDGYQTLDELRNLGYEQIPVILLTAKFSPLDIARSHDKGAAIYMRKPFNPTELINAVEYLIGHEGCQKSMARGV